MRSRWSAPRRTSTEGTDAGFTLVELLIALVLSGVIAGVIVAAMATSLNVASSTTRLVADSTDAGLISTFLYRDAQAAGAVNPATTLADPRAGVAASPSTAGWAGCAQTGAFVARFSWVDRLSAADTRVVVSTYALDAARQLTRRVCQDGATTDFVLSHSITSAVATCSPDPACGSTTATVSLTVKGSVATTPFTYTLAALVRASAQATPMSTNSASVPLLALGGSAGATPCPTLSMSGTGTVKVLGDVVVGSSCDANPIKGDATRLGPTGSTLTLAGVTDPFITVPPPITTCGSGGTNPTPIGTSSGPDALTVYPAPVSITGAVTFAPGRYVFCAGLDIGVGATVSGTGVFLFVPGGTFSVSPSAIVQLRAATAGPYANLLVWVATAQQVVVSSGSQVSSYAGYIYAPTSQITANGTGYSNIGGAIAQGITFGGTTRTRLGTVPSILIAPASLAGGQVGVAYPATTLSATGGTAPYTWSATGLPAGLALDPATGVLSGSPTVAGASSIVVTVVDATAAAASATRTIVVNPVLAIAAPAALATGQVGVVSPSVTISASGGTAPFRWAATGLPAGMTIDPATGVVAGSPTVAGNATVVVTATDALGATASRTYALAVRAALAVTSRTMPAGQVGVAYTATTFVGTGGTTPYMWSATGLPAGLTMNSSTGTISGSPTAPGSFTVVVKVNDANTAAATTSAALTIAPVLALSTTALPAGQVAVVYTPTTLAPSGGTAPYTWSATGLPGGITLNATTGVLSGTPTAPGTFAIVATVVDASMATSSANYAMTISPQLAVAAPAALPAGQVGVTYPSVTLSPSGGTAPFRWTATGLPAGLTVDAATGVVSGTPTAAGAFTVVASVTDARSASATRNYPLNVNALLAVTPVTLPAGRVGVAYTTTTATATGGTAPYTWSASGLPAGLTINASSGAISGTPTVAGSFTAVLKVNDANTASATAASAVTIASSVPAGCPLNPTGWRGEYFKDIALTGSPTLCRDDAAIDFDWGSGSPNTTTIPSDGFSARWTRTQDFAAGTYTFAMGSDDGSRLLIDGVLVLDRWTDQGYPSPLPTVARSLTAGTHTIVMEYYERSGAARAALSWTSATSSACPAAKGWQGEYYSNTTLVGAVTACRDDVSINFDWGSGPPLDGMPSDGFSVRWTRNQTFAAGTYKFSLGTDDGGRLYIDGALVIDIWSDQSYPSVPPSAPRTLSSGQHTIVVEYYERGGDARATLGWS